MRALWLLSLLHEALHPTRWSGPVSIRSDRTFRCPPRGKAAHPPGDLLLGTLAACARLTCQTVWLSDSSQEVLDDERRGGWGAFDEAETGAEVSGRGEAWEVQTGQAR